MQRTSAVSARQQALNELERLSDVLDPKLRSMMGDTLTLLRPYAVGTGSVPALRRLELSLTENATQLLGENTDLSTQLTATVDSLVAGARKEIDDANAAALSVVDFSTLAVIIAVVLSIVSSTLIVWLYVGRNLIAPIRALGAGAARLARVTSLSASRSRPATSFEALADQFNEMGGKLQESMPASNRKSSSAREKPANLAAADHHRRFSKSSALRPRTSRQCSKRSRSTPSGSATANSARYFTSMAS